MKKFLLICALVVATMGYAQQNTSFRDGKIVSPVDNGNGTVTMLVDAPKASEVMVMGDWEANGGKGTMVRNDEGIWTYTTPVLPSEMYTYRVVIDGVVGLDPTNPFVRRDVGSNFSIFFISGGVADYYQVQDVPHGSLTECWYRSEAAGMERRLSVYTPAGYADSRDEYPVLYLLHGSGGDETAWVELGNTVRIMDNLIAQGKVRPMIVVMPNGNFSKAAAPGETSENLTFRPVMSNRIPGYYKSGDYELAFDEIVFYIDKHYRTISDKHHRAVAGLSMGGFHTLWIALNHPDKFDYIGLFSAGIGTPYQQDAIAYQDQAGKFVRLRDMGYKLFWIGIGSDDFLYEGNANLRTQMDKLDVTYIYHESTRGHIWQNWRQYLVQFCQQLTW